MNAPNPRSAPLSIRFDRFELRVHSNELFKAGSKVKLKPQAARVLSLLALRAGEAVHRDEIRDALWGSDTFVDFDRSLNSCITQLRTALGDDPAAPRFIETLPKHGYRFIAPLEAERDRPAGRTPAIAIAVVCAAVALVAAWIWSDRSASDRTMLLVRPFENLSGRAADDPIGFGLTEELITALAGAAPDRLAVYAPTTAASFEEASADRYLDVDYVVEGSFRRDPNRLRITARLVDVSDGRLLWTEVYERPANDLLRVQGEVAARVAESLLPELSAEAVAARPGTANGSAHEAYLEGRHHLAAMSLEGLRNAAAAFERAVALDPGYARAWAGLADAFNFQPWWGGMTPSESARRGREAAERALAIDPDLPEGWDALGFVSFYHDFDASAAEESFRRALELGPGLAMTHYWHAGLLSATGRHDQAIARIRRAQEIDPLSPLINADAGWYYFFARRYSEAMEECSRILALAPRYAWAQACVVDAALLAGREEEARRGLENLAALASAPESVRERLAAAPTAEEADRTFALWQLERAGERLSGAAYRSSYTLALLRLSAGDREGAIAAIERAYEERDSFLVHVAVDPRLDPLRKEKRFRKVVEKMNWGQAPISHD